MAALDLMNGAAAMVSPGSTSGGNRYLDMIKTFAKTGSGQPDNTTKPTTAPVQAAQMAPDASQTNNINAANYNFDRYGGVPLSEAFQSTPKGSTGPTGAQPAVNPYPTQGAPNMAYSNVA